MSHYSYSAIFAQYRPIVDLDMLKSYIAHVPALDLAHIRRLTNQVGILQHAKYTVPNYHHGYCLDDNVRALILVTMAHQVQSHPSLYGLMHTYVAYILHMQLDNGQFRNFLLFDHTFTEQIGSEDSYGRTLYALGFFLKIQPESEFVPLIREIFYKALPHCLQLRSTRAVAYSLLGLIHYYEQYSTMEPTIFNHIAALATFLQEEYQACQTPVWSWFEKIITYDNAVLPLSLLRAANILHNKSILDIGMASALFLDGLLFSRGHLSIIGNSGWYPYCEDKSKFGQQPIEVPSMILLYKHLYHITGAQVYRNRVLKTFQWFFGANDLELQLYDPLSKGCSDGLDRDGINANQGAESTISFWTAYLYVSTSFD